MNKQALFDADYSGKNEHIDLKKGEWFKNHEKNAGKAV